VSTLQTITACPICRRNAAAIGYGVIAPFISVLSDLPMGQRTRLRRCDTCDLTYFDSRYGTDEMASLYGQYRSDDYLAIRHHWEPWYAREVNDAYSPDSDLVKTRRSFMMSVLESAQAAVTLDCVVDFGGDEGQFFPSVPTTRRIVCDVSERLLPAGIERISKLTDLGEVKPDLVILAHVLEHLPDPLQPLRETREAIADDGIIYVEVPLDRFKVKPFHADIRYQQYLHRLVQYRVPFVGTDFVSGLSRQFQASIPRFGVIKQSEHINYFSGRSLQAALTKTGFTIVAQSSDQRAKVGRIRFGYYGVAARPTDSY
jgi:hypothetical protein